MADEPMVGDVTVQADAAVPETIPGSDTGTQLVDDLNSNAIPPAPFQGRDQDLAAMPGAFGKTLPPKGRK